VLQILDALEDSLALATIEQNWKNRVGRQTELRHKFNAPDLTVRQEGYFQIINVEGHEITIGSMATDEQIGAEITNIRQTEEKPKSIMANPLKAQGLPGKLAKFMHGVEFDAGKLSERIDGLETRKGAAFSKAGERLDATEANIGEVEQFVKDLEAATNGGE
jgi:hypothetical protein